MNLATERTAPNFADLSKAQIYVIVSPDIPVRNPTPNYMDKGSGDVIQAWVKAGGVLILMENDVTNSEFDHFNTLSERFGIHFNPVIRNKVEGDKWEMGTVMIPSGTGVFDQPHKAYLKEVCTIRVSGPAKAVVTDQGDVLMAVAKYGKGIVFAVVDPWVYNEYVDRRNRLPVEYNGFAAAIDLAGWAVRQANPYKKGKPNRALGRTSTTAKGRQLKVGVTSARLLGLEAGGEGCAEVGCEGLKGEERFGGWGF